MHNQFMPQSLNPETLTQHKKSKIGAKEPQNRRPLSFATILRAAWNLDFGCVGYAVNFLSSLAPCTRTMVARSRQKNLRNRLAKIQVSSRAQYTSMGCISIVLFTVLSCLNVQAQDLSNASIEETPSPAKTEKAINKLHVLYLLRSKEFDKAIELYQEYQRALGRHDFEVLEQIALIILEQGVKSSDFETQLTSIFGSKIAGISASIDVLETAITSSQPQTQLAAIQLLGSMQDDRCEELLTRAMSSDFFSTRMDAAFQLALRKSRTAVGQIESLMYKVPPVVRFFFPQFFALIGTSDAISILRALMDDGFHATRIEAILNAARFGRDDLLPPIRSRATHLNIAEQEACATAFGLLKDSKSLPLLHKLSQSPSDNVKLAALRALHLLGNEHASSEIIHLAEQQNLFAIALLGEIPGGSKTLATFLTHKDIQLRFNAAVSLLKKRETCVVDVIKEFLIRDSRDLGFQPQFSVGNSLMSWKVVPSALQHQKDSPIDLLTLTLNFREHLLRECLELPESKFLEIAAFLFDFKQNDLMPLLISLLENLHTPEAIHLLELKAQTAGAPLIRIYCNLALYRLKPKEAQETAILNWISKKKETEMVRFRPLLPYHERLKEMQNGGDFTPEENSRLLIECYQTFALKHDNRGIDILLEGLKSGHIKNRPVLAGLLIQALH